MGGATLWDSTQLLLHGGEAVSSSPSKGLGQAPFWAGEMLVWVG